MKKVISLIVVVMFLSGCGSTVILPKRTETEVRHNRDGELIEVDEKPHTIILIRTRF